MRLSSNLKTTSLAVLAVALGLSGPACQKAGAADIDPTPDRLDQGPKWDADLWNAYYTRDQGARIIPLAWIKALRTSDGEPFLSGDLTRYGYLPNPESPDGLPVGFTVGQTDDKDWLGVNCAACHTRQITVGEASYRLDGGPSIADFQALLADLDASVAAIMTSEDAFAAFASGVLPEDAPPRAVDQLRQEVSTWYLPYQTIMSRALPNPPWGLGRLDAVGMIFNRLTGLDIGPAPTYLIPENIRLADAPVRYPFLWYAPIQAKTQWPGFADNGTPALALARNLGQVYGVFAIFHPQRPLLITDFLSKNSADIEGLEALEDWLTQLGAPVYKWEVDATLAETGKAIYERPAREGGCNECHSNNPTEEPWPTPVLDVGTDTREYGVLQWTAKTGVLEGTYNIDPVEPLGPVEPSFQILRTAVTRTILQYEVRQSHPWIKEYLDRVRDHAAENEIASHMLTAMAERVLDSEEGLLKDELSKLLGAFRAPDAPAPESDEAKAAMAAATSAEDGPFKYESRVLKGIWAAAPYLHNASVPTLADLLEPSDKRPESFAVGPAYDIERLGMADQQPESLRYTQTTTGCEDRNSGNSRCGHEYGTNLSDDEKKALLEYLKTL